MDKYQTLAANQGLDVSAFPFSLAVGVAPYPLNFGIPQMVMPGSAFYGSNVSYFGPALVNAVSSGQVPISRLNDMATRILAAYYMQGQDQGYPAVNFDSWTPANGQHVNVQDNHKTLVRKIGAASTVLLKNVCGQLPLGNLKTIALVGNDAGPNPNGPNSELNILV